MFWSTINFYSNLKLVSTYETFFSGRKMIDLRSYFRWISFKICSSSLKIRFPNFSFQIFHAPIFIKILIFISYFPEVINDWWFINEIIHLSLNGKSKAEYFNLAAKLCFPFNELMTMQINKYYIVVGQSSGHIRLIKPDLQTNNFQFIPSFLPSLCSSVNKLLAPTVPSIFISLPLFVLLAIIVLIRNSFL